MDLNDQIITKLRLKSELTEVLVCLEEFVASFFAPGEQSDHQTIFDRLPNGLSQLFDDAFLKEPITHENQGTVKKNVEELQEKLRTCKTMQLTLAFQPDDATITVFSEWVKKNVDPKMLIDLQFDKTIVGGALIVAGGIYKDYSVRKGLANRFQIQKEDIVGMMK
jgi:hypothetical protein